MEKLTRDGQAILCTVHQPSSLLFQRFNRLLLLAKGGRTVYFGEIGRGSETLLDYFTRNGASACPPGTNPAEYMLAAIGAAPGAKTEIDWPTVWKNSKEYMHLQTELADLRDLANRPSAVMDSADASHQVFAASFMDQLRAVAMRCAQQYWRTPSYIYSKAILTIGCSLLIGFSFFGSENTMMGLQNQMFGVFIFLFVVRKTFTVYAVHPLTTIPGHSTNLPNHANVDLTANPLRSPRAAIKNLRLASLRPLQHLHRASLERLHGHLLLPSMVLPRWSIPQCRSHKHSQHPRFPRLAHRRRRFRLRKHTRSSAYRWLAERGDRWCTRYVGYDYAVRFLRYPCWS